MTATNSALLAAILADPDDKLPRLVWCDWLEENGQAEKAAAYRRQIRNDERTPLAPVNFPNMPAMFGDGQVDVGFPLVQTWGGLPDVLVTNWGRFYYYGPRLLAQYPIRRVVVADLLVRIDFRRIYLKPKDWAYCFGVRVFAPGLTVDRDLFLPNGEQRRERVTARRAHLGKGDASHPEVDHARRLVAESAVRYLEAHSHLLVPHDVDWRSQDHFWGELLKDGEPRDTFSISHVQHTGR